MKDDQRIDSRFSSNGEETVERPGSVRRGAWYADPYGEGGERWWDGRRWTQQVRGTPQEGTAAMPAWGRTRSPDGATPTGRKRVMGAGWYPWDAD
jgi:hypothetical protein